SAIQRIVVVPSALTSTDAVAAFTVVAVPLEAGSLPSVVYTIRFMPEPDASSASIETVTGFVVYQPPAHGAESQVADVVGAAAAGAVRWPRVLEGPAFCGAVTGPVGVPAELSKL